MMSVKSVLLLSVVCMLGGCGASEKPVARDLRDPIAYAGNTKSNVVSYLQYAKQRPELAQRQVGFLIEKLERYPHASVGNFDETYRQLLDACQELQGLYASDSEQQPISDKQTTAKIDEIIALAKLLPGELRTFGFE